ncbi:NemA protein [Neisseriaceae bacterium B1]
MLKNRYLAPVVAAVLLSACSGVGVNGSGVSLGVGLGGMIGNHVGLGTSINIPIGRDTTPTQQTGGIHVIEQKIITYFDTHGQTSNSAVKGGFSRQLLAKQGDDFLVQDFYDTGEKRTDPMTLTREQLFVFRTHPNNGALTVYAINGNIMQQQNFRNGKLVK